MKMSNVLTAVSVAALLAAAPALAQMYGTSGSETPPAAAAPAVTAPAAAKEEPKKGWQETRENIKQTFSGEKIKATMLSNDPRIVSAPISIATDTTAKGMIGKAVYNEKHERLSSIHDIILDRQGAGSLIVLNDGGFAGLGGRLAALDYEAVVSRTAEGDSLMAVAEKDAAMAQEFSYDAPAGGMARTLPENGYSVSALLKGKTLDAEGKTLAQTDNVSFRNGHAALVVAVYNQILRMGGDRVAFDFDAGRLIRVKDRVDVKLTETETQKFKNLKKTASR